MNLEELRTSLESQTNITKIIEVKPYSALMVVCRSRRGMDKSNQAYLTDKIMKFFAEYLGIDKCTVLFSNEDMEIDFYRIDPNG